MADEQTADVMDILRSSPEGRAHLENVFRASKEYAEQDYKKGRQNEGFTQVTHKAWDTMTALLGTNKTALSLYMFLAKHSDKTGAVVASQQILMEELDISRPTLWRASKTLEEAGVLVRLKVNGNTYAYCLDPFQIWKSFATHKRYSAFLTKTLVSNPGLAEKRLTVMMKKQAIASQETDEETEEGDDENQQNLPFGGSE